MGDITRHLPYLMEEALSAEKILEIGTRGGSSTSAFLLAFLENQKGQVISIDIDAGCWQRVKDRLGEPLTKKWKFMLGNSMAPFVIYLAKTYGPYDIVFLDSSREAEQTKVELEAYAPMVKVGGKMIFHDTAKDNGSWVKGVREPIENFLKVHTEFEMVRDVQYKNGMMTLEKGAET